ncbi:MAG: PrsW family intramembrane metalloprotease [Rhodospirillales bacterium]|nr:PrsW family intramembrane metalloprotease [Rhodospirillales bacterium]MDH3790662.1 PrsW family intramembrane metalloprotease [Rhodospirillales bacterium]MDH3912160.1 PrsW family intramembrane metalloprotease [Rhodospirillales bacterium]MDH3919610.1 PrsW family intramembrane metalloprotease [Rhodospirillales bacterium]MDH3968290.1 PrsW family intramembrane metalloprotease [Rhodospirillales bacterium]
MSLAIAIAAVIPGLLLLVYFNARQDYHLSAEIVWTSVLLGAATSILAVVVELPLDLAIRQIDDRLAQSLARAFLGTGLPEEACKYLIVVWIALRHEDYERPVDALVLAVAVALGFATFENLLYLVKSDDWGRTAAARAMTAVPSHVINAMLMGYFLGLAHLASRRARLRAALFRVLALAAPTLNHGAYDLPLFLIDTLNQGSQPPPEAALLHLILGFALIIGVGSLLALAAWYDLLERDAADAAANRPAFTIRGLPAPLRRLEAGFWLLVGGLLTLGSLVVGLEGFVSPVRSGPEWARLFPQYFMLASAILPCLFGLAMFGHGLGRWRSQRRDGAAT